MKGYKLAATLSVVACGLALAPAARSDQWNHMTRVTFSQPVEVPGVVLAPGTYVFKLLDSQVDRDIVQIFNDDEKQLYATVIAIPDYRTQPSGKTVVTFEEREAGAPEAVREWFYPGARYGAQFVYPQPRAAALSRAVNQPVPSISAEAGRNMTKPISSAQAPEAAALRSAPIITQQPGDEAAAPSRTQGEPQSEAVQGAAVMPAAEQQSQLPKTASDMPLIGLLGLLSLGLAAAVRVRRRRTA